ncbi:hypothetical protein BDY19DRAFT_215173 [Irpex rosettiformis]|uniref:Uncharacterized protein n=1 Tax=Irpex rosettiformis TaxID=378272 RepID=A0ACB8U1P7_9APHY|nr:hypothetical protein BDY19DRAFT_215173 [Irpex rosettiformis]
MYFLHLSLVGAIVVLLGLLDTSASTQRPFRKFQRYLFKRAQPYTPGVLTFLSQRRGSRIRDLEANEPTLPFRAGTTIVTPVCQRTRKPQFCLPRLLTPAVKRPARVLTPKKHTRCLRPRLRNCCANKHEDNPISKKTHRIL